MNQPLHTSISINTESVHSNLLNERKYSLGEMPSDPKLQIKTLPTEKKKVKKKSKASHLLKVEESNKYVKEHLNKCNGQLTMVTKLCETIYDKFKFSGKEHHYQAALEEELRDKGFQIQQEVARLLHYKKINNDVIQLPHDIRGREDLVLSKRYLIMELKQTGKLTDKEFNQVCRYMDERKRYTDWGIKTRGMLINFGYNDLEIWYLFYDISKGSDEKIVRVRLLKKEKKSLNDLIDTYII